MAFAGKPKSRVKPLARGVPYKEATPPHLDFEVALSQESEKHPFTSRSLAAQLPIRVRPYITIYISQFECPPQTTALFSLNETRLKTDASSHAEGKLREYCEHYCWTRFHARSLYCEKLFS